jgi:hypothetical protein
VLQATELVVFPLREKQFADYLAVVELRRFLSFRDQFLIHLRENFHHVQGKTTKPWVYVDRVVGRDRHYRRLGGVVAARRAAGA